MKRRRGASCQHHSDDTRAYLRRSLRSAWDPLQVWQVQASAVVDSLPAGWELRTDDDDQMIAAFVTRRNNSPKSAGRHTFPPKGYRPKGKTIARLVSDIRGAGISRWRRRRRQGGSAGPGAKDTRTRVQKRLRDVQGTTGEGGVRRDPKRPRVTAEDRGSSTRQLLGGKRGGSTTGAATSIKRAVTSSPSPPGRRTSKPPCCSAEVNVQRHRPGRAGSDCAACWRRPQRHHAVSTRCRI